MKLQYGTRTSIITHAGNTGIISHEGKPSLHESKRGRTEGTGQTPIQPTGLIPPQTRRCGTGTVLHNNACIKNYLDFFSFSISILPVRSSELSSPGPPPPVAFLRVLYAPPLPCFALRYPPCSAWFTLPSFLHA